MSFINHDQRGFLMIEVTVSILILSVALVAIAVIFSQATQANIRASEYTVATNLAQEQLEILKSKDNLFWQACGDNYNSTAETIVLNGKEYQRFYSFNIQSRSDSSGVHPVMNLVRLAVRVTAHDSPTEVNLTTYILVSQ